MLSNFKHHSVLDLGKMWLAMRKHLKLYAWVLSVVFILVTVYCLSIPNYYKCRVTLVPEPTLYGQARSLGALSSFTSTLGIGLKNQTIDAITPDLYPNLISTLDFSSSVLGIKIKSESEGKEMTYYEYLRDYQHHPWWTDLLEKLMGGKKRREDLGKDINLFRLTKEQKHMTMMIKKKVTCSIDPKTDMIIIDVTDQDPLVAALMADSVQRKLQESLTEYRTQKARHDLAYYTALYKEAKRNYDVACETYSSFVDANQDLILASVRQKQEKLENEMQLRYNSYNSITEQLLAAKAKVQEDTPAFTTLDRATVPLEKDGPRRVRIIFLALFLSFVCITLWVMTKEGVLRLLFEGLN